jgi:hypothetical protein
MPGVGCFSFAQGHDAFLVGFGTKPTETMVDNGEALRMEIGDFSKFPEVLNHLFESAVELGDGTVDVGLYRKRFGGLWMGVRLREVDGAFSFVRSHRCLLIGSVG